MTAACQDEIQKNTEKEEKLKAKHVAAEEKEKKRLARAAAKEEKLKGREKKTEPSTADAAESEPRPAKKQRRSRVEVKPAEKPEEKLEKPEEKFEEKPEEKLEEKPADDAKRDRKAEKVKEAFCLIQAVGIAELQTELGNRQSYTLKPPAGAKDAARSTIGVLLTTQSFYVTKNIVDKNEWPECLSSLYKVGVGFG